MFPSARRCRGWEEPGPGRMSATHPGAGRGAVAHPELAAVRAVVIREVDLVSQSAVSERIPTAGFAGESCGRGPSRPRRSSRARCRRRRRTRPSPSRRTGPAASSPAPERSPRAGRSPPRCRRSATAPRRPRPVAAGEEEHAVADRRRPRQVPLGRAGRRPGGTVPASVPSLLQSSSASSPAWKRTRSARGRRWNTRADRPATRLRAAASRPRACRRSSSAPRGNRRSHDPANRRSSPSGVRSRGENYPPLWSWSGAAEQLGPRPGCRRSSTASRRRFRRRSGRTRCPPPG